MGGILHALRTPPPVRDRRGRRKLGLRVRLAGRCYRCNCLREVHGTLLFRRDIRLLTLSGGRDAAEDVNTRYHSWVWNQDGTYTFCALAWSSRRVDSSVCVTTESCGYARRTSRFQYGFCAGSDAAAGGGMFETSESHMGISRTFSRRCRVLLGPRARRWEPVEACNR